VEAISISRRRKRAIKVTILMYGIKRSSRKRKTRRKSERRRFVGSAKSCKLKWTIIHLGRKKDQELDQSDNLQQSIKM